MAGSRSRSCSKVGLEEVKENVPSTVGLDRYGEQAWKEEEKYEGEQQAWMDTEDSGHRGEEHTDGDKSGEKWADRSAILNENGGQ